MAIVLLIIYIVILIFLIVNFVKCLKSKAKWIRLFTFEIFSTILSAILLMYYDNLPGSGFMPGLTYLFEVLFSFGAMVLYSIILDITLITKLIIYLLEKKKQGKNYFPKIIFTISILIFVFGIYTFIIDLINDINIGGANATIVYYAENELGYERPVVKYTVDGKNYEAMIKVLNDEIQNSTINDVVKIHYDKTTPSQLAYLTYYENIYIPCFIISFLLFFVVTKKLKK